MAVTDKVSADAPSIVAGELSRRITCRKGTPAFITVVMTVIDVVAHAIKCHTAVIVTNEVRGWAGVVG